MANKFNYLLCCRKTIKIPLKTSKFALLHAVISNILYITENIFGGAKRFPGVSKRLIWPSKKISEAPKTFPEANLMYHLMSIPSDENRFWFLQHFREHQKTRGFYQVGVVLTPGKYQLWKTMTMVHLKNISVNS